MYVHQRRIYFKDTDAAGVVYFANALSMCHEAYEAALSDYGINVRDFFSNRGKTAVPITHAEIDFYQPVFCGDRLLIQVLPELRSPYSFQINYALFANCSAELGHELLNGLSNELQGQLAQIIQTNKPCAKGMTQHVCINISDENTGNENTDDRRKTELPEDLKNWLEHHQNN